MNRYEIVRRTVAGATVFEGEDIAKEAAELLTESVEGGAIYAVCDKRSEAAAEALTALKTIFKTYDGDEVPEFVRHVVAIGSHKEITEAKKVAVENGVDFSVYLLAPDSDEIMQGKSPKTVFIDRNALKNCRFENLAAGYGLAFSQPLRAFEALFRRKILAIDTEVDAPQLAVGADVISLAYALLEMSAEKSWEDSADKVAIVLARMAAKAGKRVRMHGEYKFLSAAALSTFYGSFLGAPAIDIMPPCASSAAADKLKELGAQSLRDKNVDFFDINGYFKISYILGEYRMDLLDKLGGGDYHGAGRFWRRLYPDAGYWLKSEITARDVTTAMKLAGARSDGLLGYAFATGVMAAM